MTIRTPFTACLLLLVSCTELMGQEVTQSPDIEDKLWVFSDPRINCTGATGGEKVTDTNDCTKFYLCLDADIISEDSYSCPDGYLCFDDAVGECSTDTTNCTKACTDSAPGCVTKCSGAGDLKADMNDCSTYYLCLGADGGDVIEFACPNDRPHFDGHKCVDNKAACCNCQIEKCENAGDKIPDPMNCHGYYMCVNIGVLTPEPVTCPDGGSFDPLKRECGATTECDNTCGTGDEATTTTTPKTSTTTTARTHKPRPTTTSTTKTSTTTTTTTTTPTTTTDDGCIDLSDFKCPAKGFYARCPYCDPSYFDCNTAASKPKLKYCGGNNVFNPVPAHPYCMKPELCPKN